MILIRSEAQNIYDAFKATIETDLNFNFEVYGDSNSGEKIVDFLK